MRGEGKGRAFHTVGGGLSRELLNLGVGGEEGVMVGSVGVKGNGNVIFGYTKKVGGTSRGKNFSAVGK